MEHEGLRNAITGLAEAVRDLKEQVRELAKPPAPDVAVKDVVGPMPNALYVRNDEGFYEQPKMDRFGRILSGTAAGMWMPIDVKPQQRDDIILAKRDLSEMRTATVTLSDLQDWEAITSRFDVWALVNVPEVS